MWREIVVDLAPATEISPPATADIIDAAEVALCQGLPADLRTFLLESDGAESEWGGAVVWPARSIAEINRSFRDDQALYFGYGSFAGLLFFADAGNGDQFAYVADNSIIRRDHETDARRPFATDLKTYVRRRLTDPEWS